MLSYVTEDETCDGEGKVGEFDCLGCAMCARSTEHRARFAEVREHRKVKAEDAKAQPVTIPPVSEERPVRDRGPATTRDAFTEEMDLLDRLAAGCFA